jgi:hypothetical protein
LISVSIGSTGVLGAATGGVTTGGGAGWLTGGGGATVGAQAARLVTKTKLDKTAPAKAEKGRCDFDTSVMVTPAGK